ncbi:alpha/beta hydrolase [Serratia ureilytica]
MMKWFWDSYAPDKAQRKISRLAAQRHAGPATGLPPALVQTARAGRAAR